MSTTAYSHQLSGGGLGLLRVIALSLGIIAAGAFVPAQATEENVSQRAGTKDELVTLVRTAIEKENFSMIDNIVNWQGVSNYKRRVFSSQILHALGRPISKIEVEDADQETRTSLSKMKNHTLNMDVTHLLRVTFSDGEPGGIVPAEVFLIGRMEDSYRIALLVKAKGTTENE